MLHTLQICIDINIEISEVDRYKWIFTSTIFRLALEITFLLNKVFFPTNGLRVTHKVENLIRAGWLEN